MMASRISAACPRISLLVLAGVLGCSAGRPDAPAPEPQGAPPVAESEPLASVSPAELSATSGELVQLGGNRFAITSPTLRAELGRDPRSGAELSFVYAGPTKSDSALASGELRRQIGLKLRAQDSCNVLYVMWRIEPSPGLVVSVKNNPGQSRHAECGDRGYAVLTPRSSAPVPGVGPGQPHVLAASVRGRELRVMVDGTASWVGDLPEAAFSFDGPVGLRSDNGEFSAELRAERLARK
jgi:hypothetical protein